ncbi:MAG: exo-alpha-sialidase [Phormidesmis sp. FL-bin-119]|nr:exo-alpha-sialidase [Pedobacter sp.]
MKLKNTKPASKVNRRKFLRIAGIVAVGMTSADSWAKAPMFDKNNSSETGRLIVPENGRSLMQLRGNDVATIVETKVICRQPGKFLGDGSEYGVDTYMHPVIRKRVIEANRYMGWPTLTQTKNGELLVAVSGDRDAHVCPWGKTQLIRSKDGGKTWSAPELVNNTPLDDRDAGIIETKKGTLLVSWFTSLAYTLPQYPTAYERYARLAEKITPEVRTKYLGNWVRRSEDGGKTWQDAVRTINTAPHGPIQLRDGRILYVGNGIWKGEPAMTVEQSSDDGRTWKTVTTFPMPVDDTVVGRLTEPHMVELQSGKLIAMFRNEPKDRTKCYLLQSESNNGGKTWSPLHSTGIWGYPPHLIQLRNGWVLVCYGYRLDPITERACISRDQGVTWDIENQISLAGALGADMGYPSSTQLKDDSILTVYYQAEKSGGPTVLNSTRWKLK